MLKLKQLQHKFGCTCTPYSQNYAAKICRHHHESSDCFEYPKKTLLKSSHPKKYLPNFLTQKNPGMKNFKLKKILQSSRHLKSNPNPNPTPLAASY